MLSQLAHVRLAQALDRWTDNRKVGSSDPGKVDSAFHSSGAVKMWNTSARRKQEFSWVEWSSVARI